MRCGRCCSVLAILCLLVIEVEGDIKVGAFNIQVFGRSKAGKADVMEYLVQIVREYDLLFIQEIRDSSGLAIKKLLADVNRNQSPDRKFTMAISVRLGTTNNKEQYAFLYREGAGIKLLSHDVYTDTAEHFEREPMIAIFNYGGFEFAIVGIHIDPDIVVAELNALDTVVKSVKRNIDNVLIMGDLNADCGYLPKYKWKSVKLRQNTADYVWHIGNGVDTTIKKTHCAYDRIITSGPRWKDIIVKNSVRVNRFDETLGLTMSQAARVSDHYPIELTLRASSRQMKIPDVYIYLTDTSRSLTKGKTFNLAKARNSFSSLYRCERSGSFLRNPPYASPVCTDNKVSLDVDVFDGTVHVGTVKDLEVGLALYELFRDPSVVMTIKPTRYKRIDKQKADIFITFPN